MTDNPGPVIYALPNIFSNVCGLVGIVIFVYKLTRVLKSDDNNKDWLNGIWFAGLLAFLIRLAGQLHGLSNEFTAVAEAKQPDINAIAGELSSITSNSLKGLLILIILLLLWGLIKGLITYREIKSGHKR